MSPHVPLQFKHWLLIAGTTTVLAVLYKDNVLTFLTYCKNIEVWYLPEMAQITFTKNVTIFLPLRAQSKKRNLNFIVSEAQRNFRNELLI